MRSTRNGTEQASDTAEPDLIAAAASLRWSRPDLTASLADHVLEEASVEDDRDRWLAAAGWAVHARFATGDGRVVASEVLDGLARWGASALASAAAYRLRVELALLATTAGETSTARALLAPVTVASTPPELRADAYCALARCAAAEQSSELEQVLRRADAAWSEVGGRRGEIGTAAVALVAAAAERRAGRAGSAVDRAAAGLAGLDRERGASHTGTPSGYLAAALTAEWISALLDAGRLAEARDGCAPLEPLLRERTRPSRQISRLRLTVARTVASGHPTVSLIEALELAAGDAADSDAPDLEAVCRSALGALHEKAGRLEAALESIRLGVAAQRRDQHRVARFQAALEAALPPSFEAATEAPSATETISEPSPSSWEQAADQPTESFAVAWQPSDGESPIGDILARSLQARNGAVNGSTRPADPAGDREESSDAWAANSWSQASGWVPTLEEPASNGGRRRRRAEGAEEKTSGAADVASMNGLGARDSAISQLPAGSSKSISSAESSRSDPEPSAQESAGHGASEGATSWLESAMADLDRVFGRTAEEPTRDVTPPPGPEPEPEVCTVVIDVARDGRRFAGRRARAVVNAVAERLTDRLPAESELRYGDTDAVSVVSPGWSRPAATEWMYQTLPSVLEGFVAADELPGTQLRASVHNSEGPIGAQLLQRLDLGTDRREGAAQTRRADGQRRDGKGATNGTNGRSRPAADIVAEQARRGRHDAAGRSPFQPQTPSNRAPSGGRRRRDEPKPAPEPAPAAEPARKQPEATDTDGLGLADLLAGALAAYRGI